MATPAALHMRVEAVVAEIGLTADKPAECRWSPLQDCLPAAEPGQLVGRFGLRRSSLLGQPGGEIGLVHAATSLSFHPTTLPAVGVKVFS